MGKRSNTIGTEVRAGEILDTLTDYHANGSYAVLKKNVTLLDKEDYAVMIRTTNFENNDFTNNLRYITKHAYEFLSKSKVYPDDILMNKIANAGSVYIMPNLNRPVSLAMNLFLLRFQKDIVNQRYIYYYLKGNEPYIKSFAIGAAATTITKENVRNLRIGLPSRLSQDKIDNILSSYDYLIDNNSRRIKILEQMAQTIYDEWFIKFHFPGYSKVNMVDSGLRKIPENWKEVNLGSMVDKVSHKYNEKKHNMLPLLDLSRIPRKSLAISGYGKNDEIKTARIVFEKGDILFGAVRPYFHKVIIAHDVGITNTSVFVIRPKNAAFRYFLFCLLFKDYTVQWATTHSGGTKMPVISWDVFTKFKFVVPSEGVIENFNKIIQPMFEEIGVLNGKNQLLKKSQNLLLSKLISGEIDVEDLDINVGDVDDR